MRLLFTILCMLFASSCSLSVPSSAELSGFSEPSDRVFEIWALSDIQPKRKSQWKQFRRAVEDVNQNIPKIDLAIVAGDLVDRSRAGEFESYLEIRSESYIGRWQEIAGNHDLKSDGGTLYTKSINPLLHYHFTVGNVLFLMMSDEQRGSPTELSDETFGWWKGMVEDNQDKIVVVVTHAPLEGSEVPMSDTRRRRITGSERFRRVLMEHRVDLWLNGHVHVPHWFAGNVGKPDSLGGTVFVNLAAVREEAFGFKDSESRVISFVCGSDKVRVRSRNHTKRKFSKQLERVFALSKKFECGDVLMNTASMNK